MSALLAIRTDFVTKNGRHDLVVDTTDYADNGANFYIQAGQRYLDIIMPNPKSLGRYVQDIAENDHKLEMKYVQNIESVYIKASGETRQDLEVKPYSWLLDQYGNTISDMSSSTPLYYAPIVNTLSPEQKALTSENYTDEFTYDYEDITFGANRYVYNGIIFRPKADKAYTMTVFARFYSLLASDTDISWHSENYPELLLMAANMMLEVFYRNSTGVLDWKRAIDMFLKGVDNTLVNQELVQSTNQMRG
jgi:hypothetical protein